MDNKWKLINLIAFTILLVIVFIPTNEAAAAVNCSDPGVICKSGSLGGNETWVSGNIYVITGTDLTVPPGVTLTIQEGVILKLDITRSLLVDGSLNINGTSGNQVIITSVRDDTGGDTDHTVTPPAAGNWKHVNFRNGGIGDLNYAEFRYGGGSISYNGMVDTEAGASVSIDHGVFKNSQYCAIRSDPAYEVTMTNMTNTDFTGSQFNGLCFSASSVGVNATWDETEAAYILISDVTVTSGITLNLGPGIVIKPRTFSTELFVDGTLNANGTAGNRVYVTSINDDSVGGQTNNSATQPRQGNWGQLYFRENSSGNLNYIDVRYGGGSSGSAAIHIFNASPSIINSNITNNPRGISVGGINSNPTINNCNIFGNSDYGMYNSESGHWITATNNSWGSMSGPYDPSPPGVDGSYNYGSGDRVNDYIKYRPWISVFNERVFLPIVFNKQ